MKKYILIISEPAENDILSAYNWYNLQLENLGNDFIDELDKTLSVIKGNPKLFAKIRKEIRKALVNRFPFGVYYFLKGNIINVIAVVHYSRDPKVWQKRT